jgi:hypothetical protein
MKLFFYKEDIANFGDDLNEWIWPKVLPNAFDDDSSHLVLGIGSILNDKLPKADKYTVIGSGWGYGSAPEVNDNWNILCVRGKITCKALGVSEDKAVIDPAYLLKDFFEENVEKKYKVSIIPHAISLGVGQWEEVCDLLGIHLIDIRTNNTEHFVNEIKASERIITEAMHGAIVADCFGVPWQGYTAYEHINGTKWNDWLSVLDHEVALTEINSLYRGYSSLNIKEIIKSEVKHLLKFCKIWSSNWDAPLPRKTSKSDIDKICQQISSLIDNDLFVITSREIVDKQVNKLKTILAKLKA